MSLLYFIIICKFFAKINLIKDVHACMKDIALLLQLFHDKLFSNMFSGPILMHSKLNSNYICTSSYHS